MDEQNNTNNKNMDIDSILNHIEILDSDHVYRAVLVSERLPEDPGYYFAFTKAEEKIVLSRNTIIRNRKFVKYWLEVVPRAVL
jgi:hypothetical protein